MKIFVKWRKTESKGLFNTRHSIAKTTCTDSIDEIRTTLSFKHNVDEGTLTSTDNFNHRRSRDLIWDSKNYSCAYDFILPILFHIWSQRLECREAEYVDFSFSIDFEFSQLTTGTNSFEEVRDLIRHRLWQTIDFHTSSSINAGP